MKQENEVKSVTGLLAESSGLYEKLSASKFLEFMDALYDVPKDISARYIAIFTSIRVFIGSMVVLDWGIFNTLLLQYTVIWILGIIFLYLGTMNLNRIE